MSSKLISSVFTAVLFVCAVLCSIQFLHSILYVARNLSHYWWFLAGGAAYYVLMCIVWRRNLDFFQTLIHEFLHTVMCVIFFHKIDSFHASSDEGGSVYHYGRQNIMISLAPYTLPLLTILLLLLRLIIPLRYAWFTLLIGFTFFMHLHAFIVQTKPSQPDLTGHGLLTSYAYILTFLPMNLAVCLYGVDMNFWYGLKYFFSETWTMASHIVNSIIA